MALTSKIKVILEVTALVLGIILAIFSIWQQFIPSGNISHDLIADIVITPDRIPPSLSKHLEDFPTNVAKGFLEDDKVKRIIPVEASRQKLSDALLSIMNRNSYWPYPNELKIDDSLIYCNIRNEGNSALIDVQFSAKYLLNGLLIVIDPDGIEKRIECHGVVKLGDLRPKASTQVFTWGLGFIPPDISVTHKEGVGLIRSLSPGQEQYQRIDGIFFSFRQIAIFCFGLLLIVGGGAGIAAYMQRKKTA